MKHNLKSLWTAIVWLVATAESSLAAVSLAFSGVGYGTGPVCVTYPTDDLGGSATRDGLFTGELIMMPAAAPNVRTYCLSPAGTVGSGVYDLMTLDAAKFGNNPASWSVNGGIENAAYLFHNFAGSVAGNNQGAAMQLALWEMIYDSTGLGTATAGGLSSGRFQAVGVSGSLDTAVNNYINQILDAGAGSVASSYAGHPSYLLRPQFAAGQDLITFMLPVPEAGTVLAGVFLLLPAGVLLLRRRSKRAG